MANYAIIETGVVANVVIADAEFAEEQGWIIAPSGVAIGWAYEDGAFSEPAPAEEPVPIAVSPRQARLALYGAGLLAGAEAALDALPEPQRSAAMIEWEYTPSFRRDHALIVAIGAALGLAEEQIDDLFRAAAAL